MAPRPLYINKQTKTPKPLYVNKQIKKWAKLPPNAEDCLEYYMFDDGFDTSLCVVKDGMVPDDADIVNWPPPASDCIQAASDGSYTEDVNATFGVLLRDDVGDCVGLKHDNAPDYVNDPLVGELVAAEHSVDLAIEEKDHTTMQERKSAAEERRPVKQIISKLEMIIDSKKAVELIKKKLFGPVSITCSPAVVSSADTGSRTTVSTTCSPAAVSSQTQPPTQQEEEEEPWLPVVSKSKQKQVKLEENKKKKQVKLEENKKKKQEEVERLTEFLCDSIAWKIKQNWNLGHVRVLQKPREMLYSPDCLSRLVKYFGYNKVIIGRRGLKNARLNHNGVYNKYLVWFLLNDVNGTYLLFSKHKDSKYSFVLRKMGLGKK